MKLFQFWRYLSKRDPRPPLKPGYYRAPDRQPTREEASLIARRLARTPNEAAAMLARYGSLAAVLRNERSPKRKSPPRLRRAWRSFRKLWP
jgi:hypothetical protein